MKRDLYQEITDSIIEQLEKGAAPWVCPWKKTGAVGLPHNARTGRAYSGINTLILWGKSADRGWSNGWLTFKQAKELGGSVRKGEKGTTVVLYKPLKVENKETGEEETIPLMRGFTVFNVDQCEGLKGQTETEPVKETSALAVSWAIGAEVRYGGDRAYFSPTLDFIQMPKQEQFTHENGHEATLLHELTHWTGHKSRLGRDFSGRFGDEAYAFEELVAEIGSAFLCASLGVELKGLQHADYVANWLRVLRDDKKAVFTASSKARQATEFILENAD